MAVQAVYHARRRVAVQRNLPAVAWAAGVLGAALRRSPREAALLLRLFFIRPGAGARTQAGLK